MSVTRPASRLMSAVTAAYGAYALARPGHVADAMEASAGERGSYDRLARGYGVRDLAIGLLGTAGPSAVVRWAMRARIASDLADCVTLVLKADSGKVRAKAAAITVGYAALNLAAHRRDVRTA
jgi:hypothetical protein